MSDLLLLACSARKRIEPAAPLAAIERYDGVFYRVLRKWLRSAVRPHLDLLIVSAQFGLIESTSPIPNYERRMTARRALELASSVQATFNTLVSTQRYRRVFVNLGKDYGYTVSGLAALRNAEWAEGAIGQRARQMKRWLEESCHVGDF